MQKSKMVALNLQKCSGALEKNKSFANFGLQVWLAAVCKYVVCGRGFLFHCAGGEKTK
jgi:hypothetical protein